MQSKQKTLGDSVYGGGGGGGDGDDDDGGVLYGNSVYKKGRLIVIVRYATEAVFNC